jgi:nucleoside-triphosphatase THEP1
MEFFPQKHLSDKWLKAAVLGSLWATIEIIIGSLLHNLKIPLAGTTLSFITVFLIISFFQLWRENGIIWRAGLICALMKSISPSAIILGPMIGILSEALILEMVIRLAGKNPVAYALGGALAVFSALLQKAATLLILYGWDFVRLLENMTLFATRQLRIENLSPLKLLWILAAIYLFSGAIAGILGYRTGQRYLKTHEKENLASTVQSPAKSDLFRHSKKRQHSLPLLFIAFFMLIVGMLVISYSSLKISAIFSFFWLLFTYWRYGQNMRYLKKPGLWLQLGFIILFSAVFWQGFSLQEPFKTEGLVVGVKMSLRALVLLGGFTAISIELKNPVIKNLLYSRGLQSLYESLELSFAALPGIMEEFSLQTKKILGFRKMTHAMLKRSQSLLEMFSLMGKNRPMVFVLSGKVNQGKTKFAMQVVEKLKQAGLNPAGFFSVGNTYDQNRKAYSLKDIQTGIQRELCSFEPGKKKVRVGRFYFDMQGIEFGREIILESPNQTNDLLVIDEIGPLEINDQGWAPALEVVIKNSGFPQLWIVRESLLKPVIRKWNLGDVFVFNISMETVDEIASTILEKTT